MRRLLVVRMAHGTISEKELDRGGSCLRIINMIEQLSNGRGRLGKRLSLARRVEKDVFFDSSVFPGP
jgi:hypothetical protein